MHHSGRILSLTVLTLLFIGQSAQADNSYQKETRTVQYHGQRLTLYSEATLAHPSQPRRYSVANLFDNNPKTAWVTRFTEDPQILEDGQLVIEFERPVYVRALYVRNGYQKSGKLFQENQRVRSLSVEKVIVGERSYPLVNMFELHDNTKEQYISLTKDWTDTINLFKTKKLIISVLDTYEGSKYQDLCLSGIRIEYMKDSGYRPGIAWPQLRKQIKQHAIKTKDGWDWDKLNDDNYRLFTDLLHYTLADKPGAFELFSSYRPIGTDQSESMIFLFNNAMTASRGK